MTTQTVRKWGNSPAVRLSAAVMQAAQLHVGAQVEVRAEGGRIVIEPAVPAITLDALLADIRQDNLHAEVATGAPQGAEAW